MSENANIDYSGLSENEAEAQFTQIENEIAAMEDKRQTQTPEFIELLRHKLGLSERLKKYQEVNNCEMRIRFIEARMRGETMPHTEYVNLQRQERRKRRNKTNTMMIVVIAMVVMILGSVPLLKMVVDHMHERGQQIEDVEGMTTVTPPVVTSQQPAAQEATQPEPQQAQQTAPGAVAQQPAVGAAGSAAGAGAGAAAGAGEAKVEDINEQTGGKEVDLKKILKARQTTALYFHSIHCPACVANKPKYAQLAAMYPEYKFYTVDVDRPFSEEIDRESPVCKQFGITHFPYYMIFNGTQQQAAGVAASAQMRDWYMAKQPK